MAMGWVRCLIAQPLLQARRPSPYLLLVARVPQSNLALLQTESELATWTAAFEQMLQGRRRA